MEISCSLQTILSAPKAAEAPAKKKVDSTTPSLCSRILSAVKYALATFVYFVTFCQVDLREKTALFANQPGFHALTSLPKKTSDLENEVFKAIISLKKTDGELLISKENSENEGSKKILEAVSKEFATMLTSAFNSKALRPVEWKISYKEDKAFSLTVYARESSDVKKLPELTASAENKDALVVSPKWERTNVALEQGDAKKKAAPIKCYAKTIDLYFNKMPITIDIELNEKLKEAREEYARLDQDAIVIAAQTANAFDGADAATIDMVQRILQDITEIKGRLAATGKAKITKDVELKDLKQVVRIFERLKINYQLHTQKLAEQAASDQRLDQIKEQTTREVNEQLTEACSSVDLQRFISDQDVIVLTNFITALRSDPQFRGLVSTVEGRKAVAAAKERPHGISPAVLITLNPQTAITHQQSEAINRYAREHFKPELFSKSVFVYHREGNFIMKFNNSEGKYLGIGLTDPGLQPAPFATTEE